VIDWRLRSWCSLVGDAGLRGSMWQRIITGDERQLHLHIILEGPKGKGIFLEGEFCFNYRPDRIRSEGTAL
jgi:hypothetical protein